MDFYFSPIFTVDNPMRLTTHEADGQEGRPQGMNVHRVIQSKCPSGDFMSRMNRLSGAPS